MEEQFASISIGSTSAGSSKDKPSFASPSSVAPLQPRTDRQLPTEVIIAASPVEVERAVRALLNALTMERFDSISDKIIAWANKSENERDGRTLIQVIRLIFENATDEATWSEMYARLCRKMMEQISPKIQDKGIKNVEGRPVAGGQLFRKYLLNRCQEEFQRGWATNESTNATAASAKDESGETALYSEEYYTAQKAKRRGLGLIKFVGELFKLQMLMERIMHECAKKLLGNIDNPEEEEIESVCVLFTTVGQLLDTPKARAHMDVYFSRMKELTKNPNVNSRMQFMLLDVIELRERKWIPRIQTAAPTTIAAVHAQAAEETAAKEKDYQRTLSMSRNGSGRGGHRGAQLQVGLGPDGWSVAGNAPPRVPPKAGDLSNFGKISKTNAITFGPTGVFANKDSASSNMFSKLTENPEPGAEATTARPSWRPNHEASVDLGSDGSPEAPPQRRKLNLLPRTLPQRNETQDLSMSEPSDSTAPSMSEEEAKTRVVEDSKEFFSVRDLGEAEVYFSKLPSEHQWLLVDKLVTSAIESKDSDARLVADFFSWAVSNNLCSPETFEKGFTPTADILDDIVVDAPKALDLMANMMKGAQLDEERRTRLASKSMDSDKLISLLS